MTLASPAPACTSTTPNRPPSPLISPLVSQGAHSPPSAEAGQPPPANAFAPLPNRGSVHCDAATNSFHEGTGSGPATTIFWLIAFGPPLEEGWVGEASAVAYRSRR